MTVLDFDAAFCELTGNPPFPWQQALYQRFVSDQTDNIPQSCNLPTGLGKTSVIAIWLIALAKHPDKMPRRLVYVVNRRTVVDQTTDEVEKYKAKKVPAIADFAISTLRGQFADNREWSADPSRPAVICGTVDMIGSQLLFSGYGLGFKGKPLHAGFLGQDVLLVHDEAHLEPAFQTLIEAIRDQQHEKERASLPWPKLRVMELTATSRSAGDAFPNDDERKANEAHPIVQKRVGAKKLIVLHPADDPKNPSDQISKLALQHAGSGTAVLVFVRKVDDVEKIIKKLPKDTVEQLTGTLRGLERDGLVKKPIFQRFFPESNRDENVTPTKGTVYLVCTSAGEVGINISADHLVCDLSTFESMAQRFGRVNRFGDCPDTRIDIVHSNEFEEKEDLDSRLKKTFDLLVQLNGDGSPAALGNLNGDARVAAFASPPQILPTTDILFDAWALTTIKGLLPSRPLVEPFLHGVEDEKSFDTQFAWREEVELLTGKIRDDEIVELMDEYPLKPHELLRVPTFGKRRAYEQLESIVARTPDLPVWVIEPDGELTTYEYLSELVAKKGKDYVVSLASRTVVLPPKAGGLTKIGTLDGDTAHTVTISYDVAGTPSSKMQSLLRLKVIPGEGEASFKLVAPVNGWPVDFTVTYREDRWKVLNESVKSLGLAPVKTLLRLNLTTGSGDDDTPAGIASEYLVIRSILTKKIETGESEWPALDNHLRGVQKFANDICAGLRIEPRLAKAVSLAAAWHDLGKSRAVWQRGAGNNPARSPVAKTLHGRPPENLNRFRHELGSIVDVVAMSEFANEFRTLELDQRELVLHLIATHHGRGRPHFPTDEAFDQERAGSLVDAVVAEVPGRFAKLLRKYGRWGLSYLESLLRAADALESRRIEAAPISLPLLGCWPDRAPKLLPFVASPAPKPSICVAVDSTNPGQFFACCGLLELADRLWPGAEGWFEAEKFCITCEGTLSNLLDALVDCHLTNTMTDAQHTRFQEISAMSVKLRKSTPGVEDEGKELEKLIREAPIVLKAPSFGITLDWFTDDYAGGSRFKTWAGRQSVLDIASSMKNALKTSTWRNEECLTFSVTGCGLPFNFDSDLGGQGGAIDVGFSFDPLAGSALTRIESMARPALELLAFIGLQRFRPTEIKGENRFLYTAWNRPLPIQVAMPAACGALPIIGASRYEFRLLYRTKYLKSFLPAIPFTGDSDE